MGKRGPKATPVELQALRGNPRRRPLPGSLAKAAAAAEGEGRAADPSSPEGMVLRPSPHTRLPRCPAWLSPKAKTAWKYLAPNLARMGLLAPVDKYALELLCHTYACWRDAAKRAEREGRSQVTESGYEAVSGPHVVERSLRMDFLKLAEQFGMTPSGRTGLAIRMDERENKLLEWMDNKRRRDEEARRRVKGR